jgi:hypothetical protein
MIVILVPPDRGFGAARCAEAIGRAGLTCPEPNEPGAVARTKTILQGA